MALRIDSHCINCDICQPECPNEAISQGQLIYRINPQLCTECVGHYEQPSCVAVCPIRCISVDPEHQESRQQLNMKFTKLYPDTVDCMDSRFQQAVKTVY